MKINIGEILAHRALLRPNKVGLVCEGKSYTFSELNRRSNQAGAMIESLGARPGDRVAILARNGVEYFDLFFGLAKTGLILVPINYRLSGPEIAQIMEDCGARVLVYGPEFEPAVEKLLETDLLFRPLRTGQTQGLGPAYETLLARQNAREPLSEAQGSDELAILYAFWAMGKPRGVMLSHQNFFWSSVTTMATLTRLGQSFLLALPMFHIGGLGWLPAFVHLGKRCVLMPSFEPDRFLHLVEKEGVNSFGVVPAMLHFIKESEKFASTDFSPVQCILSYGQTPDPGLIDEYARAQARVRNLYGLTETSGPALVIDVENVLKKPGSCGLPFFHTQVKLVDDHGMEVRRGTAGEVLIEGAHVMKGYWNQPEATADAIKGGWLQTGDIARQDDDGYYYIVDRKKEIVITGGENINPQQVEAALFEHPDIEDVAVIGSPRAVWGETLKAYAVKRPGAQVEPGQVLQWLSGRIARYKIPSSLNFVDSLPRTAAGKMEKWRLRENK